MRPVESALNLIWAVTSSLLLASWLVWLIYARPPRRRVVLSGLALLALMVVLLPAISMTDDRLAMQSPAEFEHALRRDDGTLGESLVMPTLFQRLAAFFIVMPLRSPTSRLLALAEVRLRPALKEDSAPSAVRPPPAVLSFA